MIVKMRKDKLTDQSINSFTRTFKSFLSWCNENGYTEVNIPLYKASEAVKETYTDQHHYFDGALMHIFNEDTKENGGIFSQSQGWLILAESILGHGNRAFEYFMETSPAAMNDRAEIRVMEPYVHGQFTEASLSPYEGRSHVHWLTGTASTVMLGCVEGICGIRPDADGIAIRPSIPEEWEEFGMDKDFRGRKLHIRVQNPSHIQSGVKNLTVNGEVMTGGK